MHFKFPVEIGSIFSKRLESVVEFEKSRETKQREPKRHAPTNNSLNCVQIALRNHRKYTNVSTTAFRRRGDIGKARQLNSSQGRQLSAKNPGQAQRCGRDQTLDLRPNYENACATIANRKRANKTVTKLSAINFTTMVSVFLFIWSQHFSTGAA